MESLVWEWVEVFRAVWMLQILRTGDLTRLGIGMRVPSTPGHQPQSDKGHICNYLQKQVHALAVPC